MRGRRHGQRRDHRTARLSVVWRRLRALATAAAAGGAIVALVLVAIVRLPSGTSASTLALRAMVGLLLGLGLVLLVHRILRTMSDPPPPPPATVDARTTDVVYECTVCGTRLRLEVAATGKPPKHCGEEMDATVAG